MPPAYNSAMTFEDDLRRQLAVRTGDDLREMRAALGRGELQVLARLGHRLLGAAGALELDELAAAGREIMDRAASGEAAGAGNAVERLAAILEQPGRRP